MRLRAALEDLDALMHRMDALGQELPLPRVFGRLPKFWVRVSHTPPPLYPCAAYCLLCTLAREALFTVTVV